MKSRVPTVDALIRKIRPARPRVVVFADDDAWCLAFRSLLDRPGFEVPPTIVTWVSVSPAPTAGEEHSGESWLTRSLQIAPAIMVWDADSLRIPRIAKTLRRCQAVVPQATHIVVGRELTATCQMNWTALGVATTLRNPEDLWSQRRLIQRMLEQSVDCP